MGPLVRGIVGQLGSVCIRMFKHENRNWVEFRRLPCLREVDYHPVYGDDEFADLDYYGQIIQAC